MVDRDANGNHTIFMALDSTSRIWHVGRGFDLVLGLDSEGFGLVVIIYGNMAQKKLRLTKL